MKIYIEYFHNRSDEITNRIKKLMSPVKFRPIINLSRISYGILESSDTNELEKIKKNLIGIINEELTKEDFIEKIKKSKNNSTIFDPIFNENINIFETKKIEDLLEDI